MASIPGLHAVNDTSIISKLRNWCGTGFNEMRGRVEHGQHVIRYHLCINIIINYIYIQIVLFLG